MLKHQSLIINSDISEGNISFFGAMNSHNYYVSKFKEYCDALMNNIGDYDIYPDKNRLDVDTWEKCKSISSKGFVIGGSVVLKLYGLISRDIGDIDIFKSNTVKDIIDKNIDIPNIFNLSSVVLTRDRNVEYDGDDEYNGDDEYSEEEGFSKFKNIKRFKINTDFGELDVFDKVVNYYKYDDVFICTPFTSISAKIEYGRYKDLIDFKEIATSIKSMKL